MQKWSFASFSEFMRDAAFLIQDPLALQKVITGLDDLFQNEFYADRDLQGDFYEYMLSQMSASGELGQFRTPKHIRDMMVELARPTPEDLICEKTLPTLIQTNETEISTQIDAFLKIDANAQRQEYKMAS